MEEFEKTHAPEELNSEERAFLEASRRQKKRGENVRRVLTASGVIVALAVIGLLAWALLAQYLWNQELR